MCFTIQSNLEFPWTATNAPPNLSNPATTSRANPPRPVALLAKPAPTVDLLNFLHTAPANLTLLLLNSLETPLIKAPYPHPYPNKTPTNLRET